MLYAYRMGTVHIDRCYAAPMPTKYPYTYPIALTPGQRDGLDRLLTDPRYSIPGASTRASILRYAVELLMIHSGMPLAPVAYDGEYCLAPVTPEEDTVQRKRRLQMSEQADEFEARTAALEERVGQLAECRRQFAALSQKYDVLRRQWAHEAAAAGYPGPADDDGQEHDQDQEHDQESTGRRPLGAGPGEDK